MTLHSDSVITFAFLLSIFSLICAVPIYAQIRKNSPDFAWSQHGKVNTAPFNEVDLLGIALFVFIFGSIIYLSQHAPKMEPDGVTPHSVSLTPPIMVAGMIIQQVVLVFIVFVLLVFRGTNFVELWGLLPTILLGMMFLGLYHALFQPRYDAFVVASCQFLKENYAFCVHSLTRTQLSSCAPCNPLRNMTVDKL